MNKILHSIGSGGDEIQNIIDRAKSGLGASMLDIRAFDELVVEACARSLGVVAVEVYELVDDTEILALDLSLFNDEIQAVTADLNEAEKVTTSLDCARRLSEQLSKIDKEFGLQVWLE